MLTCLVRLYSHYYPLATAYQKKQIIFQDVRVNVFSFQRQFLRGPLAEWEASRAGRGEPREVDVPRRVDPGLQGEVRRQAVHLHPRQVRGHLGQRAPGRVRLRDVR